MVAVFVFSGGGGKKEDVSIVFAGFTNSGTKARALFWLTNGAGASCGFSMFAGTIPNGGWGEVLTNMIQVEKVIRIKANEHWGGHPFQVLLLSVEVKEAKQPLKVIMEVWESPPLLSGLLERVREFIQGSRKNGPVPPPSGRHYSVTNEFHPKP
jgi:hypothetical protein